MLIYLNFNILCSIYSNRIISLSIRLKLFKILKIYKDVMHIDDIKEKGQSAVIPTNDYVFKRIFGHKGNEDITIDLLNSILSDKINSINLDENPILEKDLKDDKVGILDIKATLNNNISIDIEMQVAEKADMVKRILFYWAKLYSKGVKEGDSYMQLNKTICILITNYEPKEVEKIAEYHTEWKIIETKYRKTVLTPVFELHIISLPKLNKVKEIKGGEEKLLSWCEFLINPNNSDIERYDKIMKAKTELEKLKQDKREEWLAEQRQKYLWDMQGSEKFGYDKGMEEKSKQIAKKMLEKGMDIKTIGEITELTEEEIENLDKDD